MVNKKPFYYKCARCKRDEYLTVLIDFPVKAYYKELFLILEHVKANKKLCLDCVSKEFGKEVKDPWVKN